MDHGLPEEIMEGDDLERQNAWSERVWSAGYGEAGTSAGTSQQHLLPIDQFEVTEEDLQPSSSGQRGQSHPTLGDNYPRVGDCVYIQWVDDDASDEAPGWYFGTTESITDDGNFLIVYADNATEVLDLTKVEFVLAKPGGKFYLANKPKPYKPRAKKLPKTTKPRRSAPAKRSPKKAAVSGSAPLAAPEVPEGEIADQEDHDTEESSRDIIRKVLREYEEEQAAQQCVPQHEEMVGVQVEEASQDMMPDVGQLRVEELRLEQRRAEEVRVEQRMVQDQRIPVQDQRRPVQDQRRPVQEQRRPVQEQRRPVQEQEAEMIIEEEEEELEEEEEELEEEEEEELEEEELQSPPANQQPLSKEQIPQISTKDPVRYIESGNIIIPSNLAARHPQSQIILVQRGPNGELEEVTQTQELHPQELQPQELQTEEVPQPQGPLAKIIEETMEVNGVEGHIEEEHEYEVEDEEELEDSATEVMYPDDEEEEASEEEGEDRHASIEIHDKLRGAGPVYVRRSSGGQTTEVVVDRNGNQVLQRGNVQLVRRMDAEEYMPPHSTEQVERYDGRIISSEQMMMSNRTRYTTEDGGDVARRGARAGYDDQTAPHLQQRDVENYQQYQDDEHAEDLERLQGRLITEDAMNMLDEKGGDGDDDDYSGDDEQDPRMPRRRGKYVRKTPEELDQVPRPWQCEFCPRAFPNKYHLQIHLRTHTGEKPYRCTECDMAFSHSSNLCSHIRTHNGIKPYKCKHCGKEFGRSNNMKAHTRIHTGEKPFECRFCGKAFRFGNHLTIHERSHTGERPYKCTYCDRAFRNSSNLRTHERLHTDERPYRCRYCDRAFSGSGNLHAHERVHTGERPFQCDVCSKAFSQSSTLRIHQRIHTGDKRYQCSLCGRKFIQSNHLKTHLRRMHHIDDSLPSIRTMHKSDPYGMQAPLNPNHYRVVTKQEPDELEHYEREMQHSKPTMLKHSSKHDRMDHNTLRPSPLIVDDDVRTKTWGPGSPLLRGDEENHRHN